MLVAHGMGQQIPFETLDTVALGLATAAAQAGVHCPRPVTERVELDGQRLARVALTFTLPSGAKRVAHVYEAYWAPITEGQIGLAGVTSFLRHAGVNGFWSAMRPFTRFLFGRNEPFHPPVRSMVFILLALGVVLSLVAMNTAIVAVTAATALWQSPPAWLTAGLRNDLTAVFAAVLLAAAVFIGALAVDKFVARGRLWPLTVSAFTLAVVTTLMAGVAIPSLAIVHGRAAPTTALPEWMATLSTCVTVAATLLVALAVVAGVVYVAVTILLRAGREWADGRGRFSAAVAAGFVVLVLVLGLEAAWFFHDASNGVVAGTWRDAVVAFGARPAVVWLLLVALSAAVRSLLVQYVGDVAIYVEPHVLDRYSTLREEIRKRVGGIARAIYAARRSEAFHYDHVLLVGHSLGSVIAYDTINRLLWEDDVAAPPKPLGVRQRTRLLLTFGSPLDKTAFIFATQRKRHSTSMQEALAATVQPLIERQSFRTFPWINVYSRRDIISGRLDYYDWNDRTNAHPVENVVDEQARTFLWAHVEYWENPAVFSALFDAIAA